MEKIATALSSTADRKRWRWWASKPFLFISVGFHLLFGLGAAYFVVSRYSTIRNLTFAAGPKSPNPTERALQHRVQLQQKSQSAPPAVPKRVLTTVCFDLKADPLWKQTDSQSPEA